MNSTHLSTPCLRCGEKQVLAPKSNRAKTVLCEACDKKLGYIPLEGGAYRLYLIGGSAGEEKKVRSHRLPQRHLAKPTDEVIQALDYWDDRHNATIKTVDAKKITFSKKSNWVTMSVTKHNGETIHFEGDIKQAIDELKIINYRS